MKVTRTFHCDAQGCDSHVNTSHGEPPMGVILQDREADEDADTQWACSWDCVLTIAGGISPVEVV